MSAVTLPYRFCLLAIISCPIHTSPVHHSHGWISEYCIPRRPNMLIKGANATAEIRSIYHGATHHGEC